MKEKLPNSWHHQIKLFILFILFILLKLFTHLSSHIKTTMTDTKDTKPEAPWWKAFPEARAKCPELTADDVMKLFDDMDITSEPRSFLLVDVRRDDWVVCIFLIYYIGDSVCMF